MTRFIAIAALFAFQVSIAHVPDDLLVVRSQSVDDPPSAITSGRLLLDGHKLDGRPADEREVLYWLGNAALREADDAVLVEMALRLDSLGRARADELALAYAGFLRAERLYQQGETEKGWAETMRAASRIQDQADPRVRAIAALELCDDFNMTGNTRTGIPYCERSSSAWRTLGDKFDLGRALNLEAHARYAIGQLEPAATLFKETRELFLSNGNRSFASTIGANLAMVYIDLGRSAEALDLLRQAFDAEMRSGRFDNALRSRLDIARALVKLNRPQEAQAEVTAAIADAQARGWKAKLADLLATQAKLARDSGDLQLALSAQEQIIALQSRSGEQAHSTAMAELEERYAARERELRIGELEQENKRREFELQTARAGAAENEVKLQSQRLRLVIAALAVLALGLSSALFYQMWRTTRRKVVTLREETLHDALTGIENRRAFLRRMSAALTKPSKPPRLDVLMILDLDHFKQINDRGGHLFGDQVLVAVAACLERTLAGRAHLARLGGEEFGVLGVGVGVADGLRIAEQLRTAVSLLPFRLDEIEIHTTISIGFAVHDCARQQHDQSSWLGVADQALYSAKAHGRNRVVSAAVA